MNDLADSGEEGFFLRRPDHHRVHGRLPVRADHVDPEWLLHFGFCNTGKGVEAGKEFV
jgi:hypothetical protein